MMMLVEEEENDDDAAAAPKLSNRCVVERSEDRIQFIEQDLPIKFLIHQPSITVPTHVWIQPAEESKLPILR
jgi:hypothetical protein